MRVFVCLCVDQTPIEHPTLADLLTPIRALYEDVRKKSLIRCEYDGLRLSEAARSTGAPPGDDDQLAALAMDRYAYYVCCKCGKVGRPLLAPSVGSTVSHSYFISLNN